MRKITFKASRGVAGRGVAKQGELPFSIKKGLK